MVEKIMETKGTIKSIRFNKLNNPLAELSSRLKTLKEVISKNKVYTNTILFLRISIMTNFIIFFKALFLT